MAYNILSEARVQASVADLQPDSRSYSVFWAENLDLQGWENIFDLDIVGAWGGFLFGTKNTDTTGSIGPIGEIPAVDALVNDKIFFRMKYDKHPKNDQPTQTGKIQWVTVSDPVYNDFKSIEYTIYPDGKWHFYQIDLGQSANWVGLVNNVRFFPCVDGRRNDEFFMSFFEIGTLNFDFEFENPKAGLAGKVFAGNSVAANIAIEQGVNDRLLVNLDGFGDVNITLTSQTAVPNIIARDVSIQLGKTAIGGYLRAQCLFDPEIQRFFIQSGTLAEDSSAAVVWSEDQSAAIILGFADVAGNDISIKTPGADGDENYKPVSSYRLTTLELFSLFDNDSDLPAFSLDPQVPVIQAGRSDYGLTQRRLSREMVLEGRNTNLTNTNVTTKSSLDGTGTTFVDINHPFTDDGKIAFIAFNGVADTAGNTKWKILRPSLDGALTLVDEGEIGKTEIIQDPNGGLVLTTDPGAYSANVSAKNVRVRRGDLLGLYNGAFHLDPVGVSKPNAMFYEVPGDLQGTFYPGPPTGAGELGLPIYARSFETKNRAVVDIDFNKRLNLDRLQVDGEEELRDLEYNLAAATSAEYNVDALGEHTICYVYNLNLGLRTCFTRPNQGFNIQALNDDIVLAENGVSSFGSGGTGGVGGATKEGATYFYMNGDAEQLGTLEFQGLGAGAYDFQRDPLGIDLFFSQSTPRLDKPVGKAVLYFKDKQNMRSWQVETALPGGSQGGNGSKPGFQLVPETAIKKVRIDNKDVENVGFYVSTKPRDTISELLLSNPSVMDVFAKDGTRNPVQGVDFIKDVSELGGANLEEQLTFMEFQWNRFEWNFTAIRTQGFRWYSDFHWSTKITEFQVFAVSENSESLGDNIQPLFSPDGTAFATAELESADNETAHFKLGGSPQYMRFIFRPTLKLDISDLKFKFEEDQICFGEEGRLLSDMVMDEARVGEVPGTATPLKIANVTGQSADLILDIPSDINTARQLLYFSKLGSAEDITHPQVGPPGRVDFKSDKILAEQENVASNAITYGLRSLVSGTSNVFLVDTIIGNGGFNSGQLEPFWDLNVVSSGTAVDPAGIWYQVPRVMDIDAFPDGDPNPDEDNASSFQYGTNVFGVSESTELLGRQDFGSVIDFDLSQTVDVSEWAAEIDNGGAAVAASWRYIYYNLDGSQGAMRITSAPTASGIEEPYNTIIDGYGNNLRRTFNFRRSTGFSSNEAEQNATLNYDDVVATLPSGTRFVKISFDVRLGTGCHANTSPSTNLPCRRKFLLDSVYLSFQIPSVTTARWYKSWRNDGDPDPVNTLQGYTSSHFDTVDNADFIATAGSHHWWQPFNFGNRSGVPNGQGTITQTQGFSRVFDQWRDRAIQSFARMRVTDPGFLAAQWEDERQVVGLRIGLWNESQTNDFFADNWPRHLQLEVLKTKAELGEDPDVNNPNHFRTVKVMRGLPARIKPDMLINRDDYVPSTRLLTFLFDENPIATQGIKITITLNCDYHERYSGDYDNSSQFGDATGCPPDNAFFGFAWSSSYGISATYFAPLEDRGHTNLPLTNVVAGFETNPVYAAVDLGRPYDVELDSDLFELVSTTRTTSLWNTSGVRFSDTDTDNPNLVEWTGSSNFARWIRFTSASEEEFENPNWVYTEGPASGFSGGRFEVNQIAQAVINQARIYPSIRTALMPTFGYNSGWDDLGASLTDNRKDTFESAAQYPVFAVDLGKPYTLAYSDSLARNRHDLEGGTPQSAIGDDKEYWNPNSEVNFTYSTNPAGGTARPETVDFGAWNMGIPNTPVRWAAFKAQYPMQVLGTASNEPKRYNFSTSGQTLFGASFRPLRQEPFTENARWFNNKKATLRDISTLSAADGAVFSYRDSYDFGSAAGSTGNSSEATGSNMGAPVFAFDGTFDEIVADYWGVQNRDIVTSQLDPANNFPHSIWRTFLDPFNGSETYQEVKAVRVTGFSDQFYPTNFTFQYLQENPDGTNKDPNLDASWSNITGASFTGIDTYQEGHGFLHVFPFAITAKGIRVRISVSVYPDDSVMTETNELNQINSANPNVSGPQTRVQSIIIYDEVYDESILEGEIAVNHALTATSVTSQTNVPDQGPEQLIDGNLQTYWESTGFTDQISIMLDSPRSIDRFEWEKDTALDQLTGGQGQGAPQTFTLRVMKDGILQTVVEEVDFFGTTYSGVFDPALTSDEWIMDISRVQQQENNAASIQISELRLLEITEQNTPLVRVESTPDRHPGTLNSSATKVIYSANSEAIAKIFADGIDGNNDAEFSERDFFSVWMFINDIALLDTNFGALRLGNSGDTFYRWDFKNMGLQTGWNELKLQFSEADYNTPIKFQSGFQFNPDTGRSSVDFLTADVLITTSVDGTSSARIAQAPGIRYFDIEVKGTGAAQELEIILDDMRFIRNRFDDTCKFGKSLYLNGNETFIINQEGLDLATGTVEFWFQPDFDTGGRLQAGRPVVPAIFRIMRPDGKYLAFFYRPNQGFIGLVYDTSKLWQFVTTVEDYLFNPKDTFHVAIVWDHRAKTPPFNTSFAVYIDGEIVYGTNKKWDALRQPGASVVFGGEMGQKFAAPPLNDTALTFTPVPSLPSKNTASAWALLENLKMYNYAKTDFSDRFDADLSRTQLLNPSELIEISLDNVTFHAAGSDDLPLVVDDVANGESVTAYVRTVLPRNLTGQESRDASLLVRWKTPLRTCD